MSDARETGALFRLGRAGLVTVKGEDRTAWLNGMISNDVASLEAGPERSGCHAALLTNKGSIVADLHVLVRESAFWMLVEREAAGPAIAALGRFIVADDVTLEDVSEDFVQWSLEGPAVAHVLEELGAAEPLAPGSAHDIEIARAKVTLVAIGLSGETARRVIAATSAADVVEAALLEAGAAHGVELGVDKDLEMLRVEAGTPRQGLELDETVLPDEARLDSAISTTKGCYVGQEIVARLRSRGQVNHLLVGLHFKGDLPEVDADIHVGHKRTGEITSIARSPRSGAIALAFVRREHSEPGTEVDAGGCVGVVTELPFVTPTSPGGGI